MTSGDIHPHWKNIPDQQGADLMHAEAPQKIVVENEAPPPAVPQKQPPVVQIPHLQQRTLPPPPPLPAMQAVQRQEATGRGMNAWTVKLGIVGAIGALLFFTFVQGINYISASITTDLPANLLIHITAQGFTPQEGTVPLGGIVEWVNDSPSPEQIQSEEFNATGEPIIRSTLIRTGEKFRFRPTEAIGQRTFTLRSGLNPTKQMILKVADEQAQGGSLSPLAQDTGLGMSSQPAQALTILPQNTATQPDSSSPPNAQSSAAPQTSGQQGKVSSTPPRIPQGQKQKIVGALPKSVSSAPPVASIPPVKTPVAAAQPQAQAPVSQAPIAPTVPPVTEGAALTPAAQGQLLRENPYTVGSALLLSSAPPHFAAPASYQQAPLSPPPDHPALHAAAQPRTGPGLWLIVVSAIFSAGSLMPRKRSRRGRFMNT